MFLKWDTRNALLWRGVILHHSATRDGVTQDWGGIRAYHMSWRHDGKSISESLAKSLLSAGVRGVEAPWSDIGYHVGIEAVADRLSVQLGRALSRPGAHATEFNRTHIGICLIGNYDAVAPNQDRWNLALEVVRSLMKEFPFSRTDVLGHRETYPLRDLPVQKSCPGLLFNLSKFRQDL